MQQNIYIT